MKIINSWRFHFSKQKRSTIGQGIWNLFSYYLFPKKHFLTQLSTVERKVVSNHLSKMNLMIPFLPKLIWTLSIVWFNCLGSLRDFLSPLYIENKVSYLTTFATIFFRLIFSKAPQRTPNSTTIVLKQIHRPSMDDIHRWYLETKS